MRRSATGPRSDVEAADADREEALDEVAPVAVEGSEGMEPWPGALRLTVEAVLTLLTAPLCGLCAVMRKWLADLRVPFREVDVAAEPRARRLLRARGHGTVSVPAVLFADGRLLVEPTRAALVAALQQRRPR